MMKGRISSERISVFHVNSSIYFLKDFPILLILKHTIIYLKKFYVITIVVLRPRFDLPFRVFASSSELEVSLLSHLRLNSRAEFTSFFQSRLPPFLRTDQR